jgi:hypothetical protein
MTADEIRNALAEPFDPAEVKFKPQAVKGERALAIAYVDARVVMDRLDDVLGVGNWQDEFAVLPAMPGDKAEEVMCRLSVRIGDEWVTKCDVGGESDQPDGGDKRKAAFSDALKRTAVKFGIGRYLYRLPQQWLDFDPTKKVFAPTALEQARKMLAPKNSGPAKGKATSPAPAKAQPRTTSASGEPATVQELLERLAAADKLVADQKLAPLGEMTNYVTAVMVKAGHPADKSQWPADGIALAVKAVREYKAQKGIK